MKRQRTNGEEPTEEISLTGVLKFLHNTEVLGDLTTDDLCSLKNQMQRLYATKANILVQQFQTELWIKIFEKATVADLDLDPQDAIHFWLSARTVCKSWHASIAKLDWADICRSRPNDQGDWISFKWPRLLKLFRFTFVDLSRDQGINVSLLTSVQHLKMTFGSVSHQWDQFLRLPQLRHLHLYYSEMPPGVLLQLTNLESLYLGDHPRDIQYDISTLTRLRSLKLYDFALDQSNIEPLTNLTDITAYPDFFKKGRGKADISRYRGRPLGAYDGEWLNRLPHGMGTFRKEKSVWSNLDLPCDGCYEGEWYEGQRHGQGKYVFPNGDIYEGSWYKGDKQEGAYVLADGRRFEGQWKTNYQCNMEDPHLAPWGINPAMDRRQTDPNLPIILPANLFGESLFLHPERMP